MENIELHSPNITSNKNQENSSTSRFNHGRAHLATISTPEDKLTCTMCKMQHYLSSCPKFRAEPLSQRLEFVKSRRLCYNCLGPHIASKCRVTKRCFQCGKKHHTTLHTDSSVQNSSLTSPSAVNQDSQIKSNSTTASSD